MVMERTVLWVPGAFSWLNSSLSTNSTFSTVRVVRFLPLPGFRSTVPVSSIFLNNLITDDRHQPLIENSFRNLFAPFFYCHSVDVSRAVRRRHCVGGGAPVNFGRRRRAARPKKTAGGGGGGGGGGKTHF